MNVITAVDEHLHREKPAPFAIVEKLVNEEGKKLFPFFECHFSSNICHNIFIKGSFEPREKWAYGYFENSTGFRAHIFSRSQWVNDADWHTGGNYLSFEPSCSWETKDKMRAKKEANPEKLAAYIIKQLTKYANGNAELLK